MEENSLLTTINDDGIAELTLNRPQVKNAFDDQLIKKLIFALTKCGQNPKVRVILLKGAGDNFCAGGDLQWMQRMTAYSKEENLADAKSLAQLMNLLYLIPKPTIALLHGAVYGGGVGLAACCDIALAAKNTIFCLSEVKLGLVPAIISPYVIKSIGENSAKRYFLTAEIFDAHEALRIGLIHQISEANLLTSVSKKICDQLLQNGSQAMAMAKELIKVRLRHEIKQDVIDETIEILATIRMSDEAQIRIKDFLQKKKI